MNTKKLISLLLVVCMLCSIGTTVFATTDYRNGTDVTYNPADPDGIPDSGDEVDLEAYTITVPAKLLPGTEGPVTLEGRWASNRVVTVTAEPSVEMVNSINANDKKTLTVTFAGISEKGDNEKSQKFVENVKVSEITNALFGTWSGHFEYQVGIGNVTVAGGNDVEKNETPIPVQATDSTGRDLNANSYEIIGDDKTDLLNKLENANVILPGTEVDMLIEVESDDFDDLANTTFDVSNIAQPGDKAIILHFDETKQEWEFISEEVVDQDGKVNADFSSYSPVAFVVIKADGTREIIISKSPVLFGKYYALVGDPILQEDNPRIEHAIGYSFYEDGSYTTYWEDGRVDYGEAGTLRYIRNIMYTGDDIPLAIVAADGYSLTTLFGQTMVMIEEDPLKYGETYSYAYKNRAEEMVYVDIVFDANGTLNMYVNGALTQTGEYSHIGNQIRFEGDLYYICQNGEVIVGNKNGDFVTFGLKNATANLHYESTYSCTIDGVTMSMIPHNDGTISVVVPGEGEDTMDYLTNGNLLYIGEMSMVVSNDGNTITAYDDNGVPYLQVTKN